MCISVDGELGHTSGPMLTAKSLLPPEYTSEVGTKAFEGLGFSFALGLVTGCALKYTSRENVWGAVRLVEVQLTRNQ